MEAKDLMIGDWVYVSKNFTQKYHKIRALSNDEGAVLRGIYVNEYGVENNSVFSPNDTEPIPLTPEILEKNGFNVKKYSDGDYYADIMFEDKGRRVEINYRYGVDIDVCVIGSNNTPPFSRTETQVRYIHELQHIFKILKIDKEIAL